MKAFTPSLSSWFPLLPPIPSFSSVPSVFALFMCLLPSVLASSVASLTYIPMPFPPLPGPFSSAENMEIAELFHDLVSPLLLSCHHNAGGGGWGLVSNRREFFFQGNK